MKNLAIVLILATSLLGRTAIPKDHVSGIAGESWLNHLHRTLEETSMGKTGRLGPMSMTDGKTRGWHGAALGDFANQPRTLKGSDLYRLNCQGCHGESGLGAPPEINSVVNPVRSASVALIMERMKKVGMSISRANAAEMANQSKTALLQRLHNGGTDMPAFPHLRESEIRAILGYLNQLAGVPGAEGKQEAVEESPVQVGEHIVKSTCHICHNAAGPNPTPEDLSNGAIPPLSTLTTRTSLPQFVQKLTSGAPIVMGAPPLTCRGRMPVFYYLSEDEAADVYLYLQLYPPYTWAVLDPVTQAPQQAQSAGKLVSFLPNEEPPKALPPNKDGGMKIAPFLAELFTFLLMAGGLGFTLRAFWRVSANAKRRNILPIGSGSVSLHAADSLSDQDRYQLPATVGIATSDNVTVAVAADGHKTARHSQFYHADHRAFESSWLARQFENDEDWVA